MALLQAALLLSSITLVLSKFGEFTVESQPVELRYGEIHNKIQFDQKIGGLALPEDVVARYASGDKQMLITGFVPEMVRVNANGQESLVKLSDHYLHHYILYFGQAESMRRMYNLTQHNKHAKHMITGCHGMKGNGVEFMKDHHVGDDPNHDGLSYISFGSASGAEYRHNPQQFQAPFGLLLNKPETWAPTLHIINTNVADNRTSSEKPPPQTNKVSRLLECPCTPQRKINLKNHTIDGKRPDPPIGCSKEFAATGNPSCHLSTYVGGWRCCEHGMFLIDTDKECKTPRCNEKVLDKVYMKFTFHYEDATSSSRTIEGSACCDVTSDHQGNENVEYDVTTCPKGTAPEDCVHVAESVQPVGRYGQRGYRAHDLVDLVSAAPHLHWAGIRMTLIDHETNKTICEVRTAQDNSAGIMYGNGTHAGNEDGYLTGLRPCTWGGGKAPRFRRDHLLRSRAVYNATSYHTGVMGLWLMSVSPVPDSIVV